MVARISLRQADSTELHSALAEAEELTAKLSALIQRDADAFAQVIQALRMSKGTPAERAERSRAIEAAYQGAAAVPLEVMEVAVRMLAIAEAVAEHCAASAISDVCVAGQLSWAAVQGAAYNVKINLPGIRIKRMSKRLKPGWKNCSMRPINASSMSKSASARGRMRVDSGFGRVLLCKQPHIVSSC